MYMLGFNFVPVLNITKPKKKKKNQGKNWTQQINIQSHSSKQPLPVVTTFSIS